jgi:transcriptional regulator with XRE-family HTH domain
MASISMRRPTDDAYLRAVGLRVKVHRVRHGLTQEALAEAAGTDRTTVGHIERGQRAMTLTTLRRVAGALDVPAAALLDDASSPRLDR